MTNIKTTIGGILQILGAIGFVGFKLYHESAFTDAEAGLVLLALSSGYKGLVSADAKK